mmetsp:Transcript_16950/g.43367  ORF Transcript_16950/g.43367 Transcript_16950/m.43367 type:complete len:215 (+) Transcript_16950:540-1184(+)
MASANVRGPMRSMSSLPSNSLGIGGGPGGSCQMQLKAKSGRVLANQVYCWLPRSSSSARLIESRHEIQRSPMETTNALAPPPLLHSAVFLGSQAARTAWTRAARPASPGILSGQRSVRNTSLEVRRRACTRPRVCQKEIDRRLAGPVSSSQGSYESVSEQMSPAESSASRKRSARVGCMRLDHQFICCRRPLPVRSMPAEHTASVRGPSASSAL